MIGDDVVFAPKSRCLLLHNVDHGSAKIYRERWTLHIYSVAEANAKRLICRYMSESGSFSGMARVEKGEVNKGAGKANSARERGVP